MNTNPMKARPYVFVADVLGHGANRLSVLQGLAMTLNAALSPQPEEFSHKHKAVLLIQLDGHSRIRMVEGLKRQINDAVQKIAKTIPNSTENTFDIVYEYILDSDTSGQDIDALMVGVTFRP